MAKKEALTKENIIRDLLEAEEVRYRRKSEVNRYLLGSFLIAAVFISIATGIIYFGLLISVGVIFNAVRLIQKRKESQANKAVIESGGFVVDTDILSHIAQETIYEPHIAGSGRRRLPHAYRTVTFFYFHNCRFRQDFFSGFEWSREYHLSKNGLQNISIEGDEFYVVTRNTDHEVGQVYPKKFFDYKEV